MARYEVSATVDGVSINDFTVINQASFLECNKERIKLR